ncbi:MAG TPA: type II toxin-antitoxin system Phd/YefM family antitoxin [Pyrinomonadaceae bacterium]|nr:type II toxin-antitoxin system Phd/YefM family antitoxin [Pyrinomonadaceae bacterium]
MKKVSIFEGKNKFSKIVESAASGEPQIITKNGKETAVVISIDEYRRLKVPKQTLSEFLLSSPWRGSDLDLTRSKDTGRPGPDFSDYE